jgi:hypothetical protein
MVRERGLVSFVGVCVRECVCVCVCVCLYVFSFPEHVLIEHTMRLAWCVHLCIQHALITLLYLTTPFSHLSPPLAITTPQSAQLCCLASTHKTEHAVLGCLCLAYFTYHSVIRFATHNRISFFMAEHSSIVYIHYIFSVFICRWHLTWFHIFAGIFVERLAGTKSHWAKHVKNCIFS